MRTVGTQFDRGLRGLPEIGFRPRSEERRRPAFAPPLLVGDGPGKHAAQRVGYLGVPGLDGANFSELLYFINVDDAAQEITLPAQASKPWLLHPVLRDKSAADPRPRQDATHDRATGRFTVPARTALVYVVD